MSQIFLRRENKSFNRSSQRYSKPVASEQSPVSATIFFCSSVSSSPHPTMLQQLLYLRRRTLMEVVSVEIRGSPAVRPATGMMMTTRKRMDGKF